MMKVQAEDTRPPITCTSCRGDGYLHYSESIRGGPSRHCIDKEEPCWTCGGKGHITSDAVNIDGNNLYDIIAAETARQAAKAASTAVLSSDSGLRTSDGPA